MVAVTGHPCGPGNVNQGMGKMAGVEGGCKGTEVGWVAGGNGTDVGEGAEGGRAGGKTTHLQPHFGCEHEGMEVPLATASWCTCASVF
jgi:hypothetical protein